MTHFVPQPDCVTSLTGETYDSFFKKNHKRSIMVMYYIPSFLFYPGEGVEFDGKQIETNRGEGIVLYLNEILGRDDDME